MTAPVIEPEVDMLADLEAAFEKDLTCQIKWTHNNLRPCGRPATHRATLHTITPCTWSTRNLCGACLERLYQYHVCPDCGTVFPERRPRVKNVRKL